MNRMTNHSVPGPPPAAIGRDAADGLSSLVGLVLRLWPHELSLTTESVVAELWRAGPRRLTELATMTGIAQPSMTELVSRLCRAGLAERRRDPDDRRVVLVALTSEGAAGFERRREATNVTLAGLVDQLPPADVAALQAALPAITAVTSLVPDLTVARSPR